MKKLVLSSEIWLLVVLHGWGEVAAKEVEAASKEEADNGANGAIVEIRISKVKVLELMETKKENLNARTKVIRKRCSKTWWKECSKVWENNVMANGTLEKLK